MKVSVCIKSGTGNHFDYDGCDLGIADIEMSVIPQINTVISIFEKSKTVKQYLVREIKYHYNLPQTEKNKNEFITIYVIPY